MEEVVGGRVDRFVTFMFGDQQTHLRALGPPPPPHLTLGRFLGEYHNAQFDLFPEHLMPFPFWI